MDDLISRASVEDLIMETDPWWCEGMTRAIFEGIKRLPTIGHVKRGKWEAVEYNDGTVRTECSVCGYGKGLPPIHNYCPNCGTMMKGDVVVKGEKDERNI